MILPLSSTESTMYEFSGLKKNFDLKFYLVVVKIRILYNEILLLALNETLFCETCNMDSPTI